MKTDLVVLNKYYAVRRFRNIMRGQQFLCNLWLKRRKPQPGFRVISYGEIDHAIAIVANAIEEYDRMFVDGV